ncbi:MAG: hypothetical protein JWM05_3348 [Acidimicrobiales bacterium]|nr:hypothetical protein [Acidimicrobiales bacterium]
MSEPYVGEIRMFGGNFAPAGWMFCEGQILAIDQFDVLFILLGTTYGGDGQTTFALPDLRGRVPVHMGASYVQGQLGGQETVTLTTGQIPSHSHAVQVVAQPAESSKPAGRYLAQSDDDLYDVSGSDLSLQGTAVSQAGGSQPHDNMQPFLCVNFIISLSGIFPSQG